MTDKSIAIIGAGIAGLSVGCYAQMNGYRSQIFEMHSIPGGLCTARQRKGYTFKPLPGLDGFYMAGQWAGGIGLSTAAIQRRKAIQTVCKRDGQRFVTSVP